MALAFPCLKCGHSVTTDRPIGARVPCPSCGGENVVPADARQEGPPPMPVPAPPPAPGAERPYVNNHLAKAILVTIFCCLPLGIVSIVKAAQVNSRVELGAIEQARRLADEANTWANWSLGIGLLGSLLYGGMLVIQAAMH
jgi:Interferon-induced transmembrane protein